MFQGRCPARGALRLVGETQDKEFRMESRGERNGRDSLKENRGPEGLEAGLSVAAAVPGG